MVLLEVVEGQLLLKDQIREYMDRGNFLETWSYLDFFLGTYDGKTLKDCTVSRGRPTNIHVPYCGNSNRPGRCRVLCMENHETMPYFPGRWFPKCNDDGENGLFHASMLVLLKPWCSLQNLKNSGRTFHDSFNDFMAFAPENIHFIVENIQFFHECADSVRKDHPEEPTDHEPFHASLPLDAEESLDELSSDRLNSLVTDADVDQAMDWPFSAQELLYADVAIGLGLDCGALAEHEYSLSLNHPAYPATVEDMDCFDSWDYNIASAIDGAIVDVQDTFSSPSVQCSSSINPPSSVPVSEPSVAPSVGIMPTRSRSVLNDKQKMAHDIVASYLCAYVDGQHPPQRLLVVHGQGGTGKTALLRAVADTFDEMGSSSLLAKTAMSSVAASMVCGQTLHMWAGLPIKTPPTHKWVTHPSREMARRWKKNMSSVLWLTIDEMSMLTAPQLSWLSQVTSNLRTSDFSTEPSILFGGLSVILLGDMHQFPPIANTNKELYNHATLEHTSYLSRTLFEQFEMVIRLEKQMRIQDPVWEDILTHTRTGDCTAEDLAEIDRLVLGNAKCILPDFLSPP